MNLRKKANLLLSTALSAAVCASFTLAFYSVPVEAQVGNTGNRAAAMQDGEGTEVDGNTVIEFKDPKFKAKILDLMHNFYKLIPQDVNEITAKTAAQIQFLDLDKQGISDLSGLEYFTGLERLKLQDNQIQDLKPLQNLTHLTELWLRKNKVTDLTPLQGLTELKTLLLTDNLIEDLEPIEGLNKLQMLDLRDNQIDDLTPLKDLHNLTTLDVSDNGFGDLTALEGLSKLQYLQANDNDLLELPDFKNLTELYDLRLDNNRITDLTPLKGLAKLNYISLSNNQVSDLTPLQDLKALTGVWITNNQLADLTPLEKLPILKANNSDYTSQKISLSSDQEEVELPLKNSKDLSFSVQGGDAVGTVADGKFTLKHELPYKGAVKINFSNTGKVGQLDLEKDQYTGTITINADVKKKNNPVQPPTPQPVQPPTPHPVQPPTPQPVQPPTPQPVQPPTPQPVQPPTPQPVQPPTPQPVQPPVPNPPAAEQKTVTFMLGDASLPVTIKVETGKTVDTQLLPTAPAKAGFTFKEWNTEKDGKGKTFTKDTVVTENMTLYAIYTANTDPAQPVNSTPVATTVTGDKESQTEVTYEVQETTADEGTDTENAATTQKNSRRTVSKTGETSCAASCLQLVEIAVAVLAAITTGKRKQ